MVCWKVCSSMEDVYCKTEIPICIPVPAIQMSSVWVVVIVSTGMFASRIVFSTMFPNLVGPRFLLDHIPSWPPGLVLMSHVAPITLTVPLKPLLASMDVIPFTFGDTASEKYRASVQRQNNLLIP